MSDFELDRGDLSYPEEMDDLVLHPLKALKDNAERRRQMSAARHTLMKEALTQGYSIGEIASATGETKDSVRVYCTRHGLYKPRPYERRKS